MGIMAKLTLTEAIATGRLDEFADEAEARLREMGVAPPTLADFEAEVERAIRRPLSEGRTLRSASRDGSRGK